MGKHLDKLMEAKQAIDRLSADENVDKSVVLRSLLELRGDVDLRIDVMTSAYPSLEADL